MPCIDWLMAHAYKLVWLIFKYHEDFLSQLNENDSLKESELVGAQAMGS